MIWLLIVLLAFIFQIATILVLEFRNPDKAMAWLLILFCIPLVGFVLYYLLAQDYTKKRKLRKHGSHLYRKKKGQLGKQTVIVNNVSRMQNPKFMHHERLFGLLSHLSANPITGCNETKVLEDADLTYTAMLEAMDTAKDHIHIEFYIFRDDMIGTRFQEMMIAKASEGVKVRLLCDGFGSYHVKRTFLQRFKDSGVEVHIFLPPLLSFFGRRANYRNHRKIVVVDGTIGFVGGINIGDDYLGLDPKMGYWRDTHVEIRGDAVYTLQNTFITDWRLASGEQIDHPMMYPKHNCKKDEQVQILTSGPDQHGDAIQEMFFGAIAVASQRIWITSPYFIPDDSVYEGLKTAAISGVEVKVLIPFKSDSRIVHLASLSYVEDLMLAGVKFYQYTKGFVHAKVMIVDDLLATVGTANMDKRSFFCNFELTALMFDQAPIKQLEEDFINDLNDCEEIDLKQFLLRSRFERGAEIVARMLSPLL